MDRRHTTDVVKRLCCLTPCWGTVEKDRVDDAGIQPKSTAPWTSDVWHKTMPGQELCEMVVHFSMSPL
uniref:Uncharacterized protein n=1 Tax=Trichogramma kaykai TaxID=54128 RepID=A0ABD2WT80_9HYME